MSGFAIHSTQENSNSDRLYMYRGSIRRLGNLPKTLVQFSVLCGCSTDKVKRELRLYGYTFSKLRNEERNRRILMLDRKIKIPALYQEMGFSTKNGFSEWHIKYYGFSWSERKFDDLSRYGYRNATDCKHL